MAGLFYVSAFAERTVIGAIAALRIGDGQYCISKGDEAPKMLQ
jgi:hypothetical protein